MRLPDIRYGTESYPERVARRLRGLNLAAWIATTIAACGFATNVALQFLDPKPGLWKGGAVAALAALIYASVPLLHRFGTLWSALTFTLTLQAHLFSLTWLFGTGGGWQMTYLTASALNFVLTGAERILFSAVLAALAALQVVVPQFMVPYNTGLLASATLFALFVAMVIVNVTTLIGIITFVVREAERGSKSCRQEPAAGDSRPIQVALSRLGEPRPTPAAPRPQSFRCPIADRKKTGGARPACLASMRPWRR